jgi:hypothetical protein
MTISGKPLGKHVPAAMNTHTFQHFEIIPVIHCLPLTEEIMMHNTFDVRKAINMTFTFGFTRCAFFGLGKFFPTHCEGHAAKSAEERRRSNHNITFASGGNI